MNPDYAIEEMKKTMLTFIAGREFNRREFEDALDKVNRGLRAAPNKALQDKGTLTSLDSMVYDRLVEGNYTAGTLPYIANIIATYDRITNNQSRNRFQFEEPFVKILDKILREKDPECAKWVYSDLSAMAHIVQKHNLA